MKILRCAQDDKGVQDDKGDWVCTLDSILRRGRNDLCELFVTLHVLFLLKEDYGKNN